MLQRTAGSACFSLPMSRLYPRGESATLRAELSEEGMQMKKQLRGLFCAAALAAVGPVASEELEEPNRASSTVEAAWCREEAACSSCS